MDATDYRIIAELQEDGRLSMKELATRVALSPPAVAERVKRLEEADIIQGYKAVVNYEKLGKTVNALINVEMNVQRAKKFAEFVIAEESIVECHHVTGPYCQIVRARLDNMASLEKLIGKIQVFGNTETFIILSSMVKGSIIADDKKADV